MIDTFGLFGFFPNHGGSGSDDREVRALREELAEYRKEQEEQAKKEEQKTRIEKQAARSTPETELQREIAEILAAEPSEADLLREELEQLKAEIAKLKGKND